MNSQGLGGMDGCFSYESADAWHHGVPSKVLGEFEGLEFSGKIAVSQYSYWESSIMTHSQYLYWETTSQASWFPNTTVFGCVWHIGLEGVGPNELNLRQTLQNNAFGNAI